MKKRDKLESMKKRYRAFRHNINYKENYFKNMMIIILILLVIDLIILYLVW